MKTLAYVKLYVEHAKKLFNFKTKVEPWLHIAMVHEYDDKFKPGLKAPGNAWYAIYIWDTREVVESGIIENKEFGAFAGFGLKFRKTGFSGYPTGNDNHKSLKGDTEAVKVINKKLMYNML